jgi:hypothetical protein
MMKVVGGPRSGQAITIAESPGGPEVRIEGIVLEYAFTEPGRLNMKMYFDVESIPSVPGMIERYRCHEGAWHYIDPAENSTYKLSPPVVME